jgi:hypothetical protein
MFFGRVCSVIFVFGSGGGGGRLSGGMRRDVVVGINRKSCRRRFLCAAGCAVHTWITPDAGKGIPRSPPQ